MKNLILVVLLCAAGYGAKAQTTVVTITNNTSCTVYFWVRGGPVCGVAFGSGIVALAPGATTIYSPSTIFAPPGSFINEIDVFQSTTNCPALLLPIRFGGRCTGLSTFSATYVASNSNCIACSTVTATWVPTIPPGSAGTLTFN